MRNFLRVILFTIVSLIISIHAALANNNINLGTKQDRLSYSMGIETGKALKNNGVQINTEAFVLGLKDGIMNSNNTLLTQGQMQEEIENFRQETQNKMQTDKKQAAQKNHQLGAAFLAANKSRPGIITTPSGLQYKILTAGTGPRPSTTDRVVVDYEGRFLNGKIFDSSYQRGQSIVLPVNGVISGWQEALKLMPVGSVWEVYIPSNLAYGEKGAGDIIDPNETLIFKVHLIAIQGNSTEDKTSGR